DGSGTLTIASSGSLVTGGGSVTLIAADYSILGPINVGTGNVAIAASRTGSNGDIAIGSGVLTVAELQQIISSGTVTIGKATTKGTDGNGAGATTLQSDAITVNTASLNFSEQTFALKLDPASSINLGVDVTTNNKNIDFTAPLILTNAVILNSGGGNITIASLYGEGKNLTLAAGIGSGTTTVTGNVTNLGSGVGAALIVSNGVTGVVDFQGSFAGNSGIVTSAGTNLKFGSVVTLGNGDTASNMAGAVELAGTTWSGYDGLTIGTLILSTSAVNLDSKGGNITLSTIPGGSQDLTLSAGTGNVSFVNAVGSTANRLGILTIAGAADVTAVGINAASFIQTFGTGTTTLNGVVDTTGVVSLTGKNLVVNNSITTKNGGAVTFNESGTVTIATDGNILSDGAVTFTAAGGISTAGNVITTGDLIAFMSDASITGPVIVNSKGGNISLADVTLADTIRGQNSRPIIASNGGNISYRSIVGTSTQYLDLRADVIANLENPAPANRPVSGSANGGTINGTILKVWNLTVGGTGGNLGQGMVWNNDSVWKSDNTPASNNFPSTAPTNSEKIQAQVIMTVPSGSGSNFTFNGYNVTGHLVDEVQSFSTPDLSKNLSSESKADLFTVAGQSGDVDGDAAESAGFGVLGSTKDTKEVNSDGAESAGLGGLSTTNDAGSDNVGADTQNSEKEKDSKEESDAQNSEKEKDGKGRSVIKTGE
ncbi:MAG: hypothetical protein HQM06_16925, partial [Magnetococcales bacterium]|nr:hypothetical protein [Magnetococcales bacterium]